MPLTATAERQANALTPVALNGARVTSSFRDALFDAANRRGISVNEFVLLATGEKLRSAGACFGGVFRPGDMSELGR